MQSNINIDPIRIRSSFSCVNYPLTVMQIDEKDFISFVSIKEGLSDNSIDNCRKTIRLIKIWFGEKELTKDNVESFFIYLKADKKLKPNTLNAYLFVFRHLVTYCKDRGFPHDFLDGFKSFKKNNSIRDPLTPEEIETLYTTSLDYGKLAGKDCSFLDFRNKTLTKFLALTGVRFSEAKNLQVKHLNLSLGRITLVETKNGESRTVHISESLISELNKLIEGLGENFYVFRNARENRVNETDFSNDLKKRSRKAGIAKNVHPHLFRHSFATQLLMEGVDVAIVSKILGHKDIKTTMQYLHFTDNTLRDGTLMHPLIRKNANPAIIFKIIKQVLEKYTLKEDKRFKYVLSEDGKSLKFELRLN
ncbi:tyrosine-type recombinase/integrase [Patescibacteria group bacterium]|nr:tyrosine-type recombinase/integrase [Patescibacteria group bacterium]